MKRRRYAHRGNRYPWLGEAGIRREKISVSIRGDYLEHLDGLADLHGTSRSAQLERALADFLHKNGQI